MNLDLHLISHIKISLNLIIDLNVKAKTIKILDEKRNIAENIPTRNDGYWFASWNTKQDGTGTPYSPNEQIEMDSDVTLYAQWEKKTRIKITCIS